MSADDHAVENGEEVNEFQLIENFVCSVLPNNSQPTEAEVVAIAQLSNYDRQALRSNFILNMANLIEMVTYLDNPDDEIEQETISSIDILTMECFADMVRLAFVLNGGDAKLFCARVLSAFDYNENNPPASPDNTAVRYLEESLAYFIQEDEDDVKTFLRSLQVLNHERPDITAIKWIGGQMFAREGGECLYYDDFIELVVTPYEQKAPEREAARARAAGLDFGDSSELDPGEEGHHPVQKLFIEQLDELLAEGRAIGGNVESMLDAMDPQLKQRLQAGLDRVNSVAADNEPVISVVPNSTLTPEEVALSSGDFTTRGGPIADTMEMAFGGTADVRAPTLEEATQGYSPSMTISELIEKGKDNPLYVPITDDPVAEAARLQRLRLQVNDTSGVEGMYPDLATARRLGLPDYVAVDMKHLVIPGGEDGPLVNKETFDKTAFKPFEFEGNRRERDVVGYSAAYRAKVGDAGVADPYTRIPPSLLADPSDKKE